MLDLGFLPDVERILEQTPSERQTMLFSATMPSPVVAMARKFMRQPTHIRAEENDAGAIHERTRQFVYRAHSLDKIEVVARALQAEGRGLTMIFSRTKRTAQKVADDLAERGFAVAAVHGDLGQGAREQALRAFRSGKVDVLISTDVAARGIDIDDVTHVINFQCPEDDGTYVHRIGRTGRAGREGVAITLVDWDEEPRWKLISDTLGLDMPEPVETYSTSEHLFSDLGIPEGSTGRLPLAKRTRAGLAAEPEEDLGGKKKGRNRKRSRRSAGPASDTHRTTETGEAGGEPRQRRRRRRGSGGGGGEGEQPAETQEATTATSSPRSERPARTRRRRSRGGVPVSETPNAGETGGSAD
jgi:superfamily II DNA/RNA helicase